MVYIIEVLLTACGQEHMLLLASCQQNLFNINHCCVYNEKILMMDRGTLQNMQSFNPKINFEKLFHLFGFIIRNV